MVDATVERAFFYSNPAGRVGLWVHVDQQCRNIGCRKTGGEIDGRGRLTNSTFLIGDCNDFSHMSISRRDEMKVRQRRANYHIRNSSESEGGCSTWNGWMESGRAGEWEGGRIGYFLCLALSLSPAPSPPRSPALPLSSFHVERMMFITYL